MPSPAAGKSDTPRTPTKLGRKPQQSAPKLNKPQSQAPDTSDVSEKAQSAVEDTKSQAQDTAEDTKEQAKDTAEDTKESAEDTTKDTQQKAEDTADDTKKQAEDTAEDTTGKVSQAGDELEEAEPKPIDDDTEDVGEDDEEAEETGDDATQKAGDDAEDTVDNTEDDATDTASKAGEGALSGARGLAGRASNLAGKASKDPKGAVEDASQGVQDTAEDAAESTQDTAQDAKDTAEDATDDVKDTAGDAADDVEDKADDVADDVEDKAEDAKATADDKTGDAKDTVEDAKDTTEDAKDTADDAKDTAEDAKDGTQDTADDVKDSVEDTTNGLDLSLLKGLEVDEEGLINKDGKPVGRLVEGDAEDLAGYPIGDNGEILDDDGDLVGRCELLPEDQLPDELKKGATDGPKMPPLSILKGLTADKSGQILNEDGDFVGHLVDGDAADIQGKQFNEDGEILDDDGNVIARAELHPDAADLVDDDEDEEADEEAEGGDDKNDAGDAVDGIKNKAEDAKEEIKDTAEDAADDAKEEVEDAAADVEDELPGVEALEGLEINSEGNVLNDEGEVVGHVDDDFEGDIKDLKGLTVNDKGEVVDSEGNVLGQVELAEGAADKLKESAAGALDIRILDGLKVNKKGKVLDAEGEEIGELKEGEAKDCAGKTINDKGEVLDKEGKVIGKVDVVPGEAAFEAQKELKERLGEVEPEVKEVEITPDIDVLEGLKVNKKGQVLDEEGEPIGELAEGDAAECAGKKINEKGEVLDKDGNVIGKVKTLSKIIEQKVDEAEDAADEAGENAEAAGEGAEDAEDAADEAGEGAEDAEEAKAEAEDAQDAAEDAQDAAEDAAEDAEEAAEDNRPPLSILDGLTVNKSGKIIDSNGNIIGELTEGDAKKLSKAGITCDAEGQFWDNKGNVIGRAQTVPQEDAEEEAPFSGLEGLIVVKDGFVEDENGNRVGQVVEGDAKKLVGRAVDEDGDILDKKGSVVGHAERYDEPEPEEQPEEAPEDLSILTGRTVNKQGNVIGDEGVPIGRLVEGKAKDIAGRKIDENGQIWDDSGNVVGRVELIPRDERETKPEGIFGGLEGLRVVADGKVADEDENIVGEVVEGNPKRLVGLRVDEDGDILDKFGNVKGHAEPIEEEEEEAPADLSSLDGLTLNKQGKLVNSEGIPIGRLVEGNLKELAGRKSDGEGLIHNDTGKVVGRCELIPENERETKPEGIFGGLEGLRVVADGQVADSDDNVVGVVVEGDAKRLVGLRVDEDGDILDKFGNVKGHAEPIEDEEEVPADLSSLDGLTLNKQGKLVNSEGIPIGRLVEGNLKELAGRKSDGEGHIYNDTGKVVGRCELIPENERESKPEGIFGGLEGLRVVADGKVADSDDNIVGVVVEGNAKRLIGLHVDEDGDILDKFGNVKGHAEPIEDEEEVPADLSILDGLTLNKQGYLVNNEGIPVGKLVEGNLKELAGRKSDGEGLIHGDTGKVVGRCELIPDNERVTRQEGPFAGYEGLRVVKDGFIEDNDGNRVGQITEGDAKRLVGHSVDEDGDIIDKYGNVKGHAEPWEDEEPEEVDLSALAGCTVNKAGNVVDSSGTILGRVSEGDPATLVGKKVDGKGQIWDNAGNIVGKAELVHGASSGPEGPFAGFDNNTVSKDGTVLTADGSIIGRVIEGDIKKLTGHHVDEDGDINDKNGNVIGKAERWEPEEKERRVNPMSGMHVNKEGEVRDENGDLIGRLTAGDLGHCAGLEIDDNGYVIDNDGNKVGEVTLLENIHEEEEEVIPEDETDEERQRREDSELADKMAAICQQTLERVQPVMKQITEHIEKADRTPRDELDEEELVNNVKPLIEEGSRILNECNGSLRGLDPDGRIAAQAKGRQQTGEASPEEYKLADCLKELTASVVTTIDNAKKKISDMPHAKKKLNPLWALLTEPLFQIIAAVGLLLTGVLNLVGKLLNGLGLGGLVNGLLGGLGINKLLSGLGLGGLFGGDKKDKKKGGSAMSNIPLVGGLLGGK